MGRIFVYSTLGCRHCMRVKNLLKNKRLDFVEINLSVLPERREEMMQLTNGARSVPQVFFNDVLIGGTDEIFALEQEGLLEKTMRKAFEQPDPAIPSVPEFVCNVSEPLSEQLQDLAELYKKLRDPKNGLKTRKGIFRGSQLVLWLEKNLGCSEQMAIMKGEQLQEASMIYVVYATGYEIHSPSSACSIPFANDDSRYQFWDAESVGVLNVKNFCSVELLNIADVSASLQQQMLMLKDKFITTDGSGVNYVALADSHEFRDYVNCAAQLQLVNPCTLSPAERKAFFINIYNALIIHGYIMVGPPQSIFQRRTFFNKVAYNIGGLVFALNDIEHGVLRGNRKPPGAFRKRFVDKSDRRIDCVVELDPRIHFALNCGAKSCPPVSIYNASSLEEELQLAAESFCQTEVTVHHEKRQVVLSKLFEWYGADFGKDKVARLNLIATFLKPSEREKLGLINKLSKVSLKYKPYDWTVNEGSKNTTTTTTTTTTTAIPLYEIEQNRLSLQDIQTPRPLSPTGSPPYSPTFTPPGSPPLSPLQSPLQSPKQAPLAKKERD